MGTETVADPACELRFGQVGIASVRVLVNDPAALCAALAERVLKAPQLFARAAVVLDLSHLANDPGREDVFALLSAVREAGMLPVALAYGTSHIEALARALDLPLIAKFRAGYEPHGEPVATATAPANSVHAPPEPNAAATMGSMHHAQPVRSGQQVYAEGRDLVIAGHVAAGAEVISDGNIHIYGSLRGRALAGASGNPGARIYCQSFHAELVSIAGRYRTFEQIPEDLAGRSVQCWLDGEKLVVARL